MSRIKSLIGRDLGEARKRQSTHSAEFTLNIRALFGEALMRYGASVYENARNTELRTDARNAKKGPSARDNQPWSALPI